ncbi:MAG: radical SAM protein [Acidimicrobiia bacterium]|nr:radical SAM protein [Acidimicrobiia bacterium]
MRILLISSYELGHQPFHVASAAAALRSTGHEVRVCDLSLEPLREPDVAWSEGVALAVPMHTAMRIALGAAQSVRKMRPDIPLCFFGLYAGASDLPIGAVALAGEYEPDLIRWAAGLGAGAVVNLQKSAIRFAPDRSDLAPLTAYVGLELAGRRRTAGSTAATRGCRYRCRHCPVPVVYDGKFRPIDRRIVLEDIDRQVAAGAGHISFSDPDFLNGPAHALRVLEEARLRNPELTFDVTIKVEHLLRHRHLLGRMAELGVVFVVSAFETTNDEILHILDKGHTASDLAEAVHLLRACGIDVRPTWLPFTPWSTLEDLVEMLRFMDRHDLDVDPIQLTIRLLIPSGSLLLDLPESQWKPGPYDAEALSYSWIAADPVLDALQSRLVRLVDGATGLSRDEVLATMTREILAAAGIDEESVRLSSGEGRPRLTEPWFC